MNDADKVRFFRQMGRGLTIYRRTLARMILDAEELGRQFEDHLAAFHAFEKKHPDDALDRDELLRIKADLLRRLLVVESHSDRIGLSLVTSDRGRGKQAMADALQITRVCYADLRRYSLRAAEIFAQRENRKAGG